MKDEKIFFILSQLQIIMCPYLNQWNDFHEIYLSQDNKFLYYYFI